MIDFFTANDLWFEFEEGEKDIFKISGSWFLQLFGK